MIKYVLLFLFMCGCEVNASKFGHDEAVDMAEEITYVKDVRTDLCFALIASRKAGNFEQSGMGMAEVPCEKVEKYLER